MSHKSRTASYLALRRIWHDNGTDGMAKQTGQEWRDISLIDSRLKLTSEHLLKRRTWSFTHASEQRASLQLNFYWCPIWPLQLLSLLFWLSRHQRDTVRRSCPVCLAVPSVPSCFRLTRLVFPSIKEQHSIADAQLMQSLAFN